MPLGDRACFPIEIIEQDPAARSQELFDQAILQPP
jgi:hypothetical protein